jgi:hypothetical protein
MSESTATPAAPAEGPPRFFRRSYLIDKTFQFKYTAIIVGIALVLSLIFGYWMYRAHKATTAIMELPAEYLGEVQKADSNVVLAFVGLSLIMAALLGGFGVIFTHRVAGPLYVIAGFLEEMAAGRYPDFRPLRKGDELQEFFETFQKGVTTMRDREQQDADEIDAAIARLGDGPPDAIASLKAIRDRKRERLKG